MPIAFTVYGTPAQQGSKSFVMAGGRPRGRESNEAALKPWRAAVAAAAAEAMSGTKPIVGPVELDVIFVFARPRAHFGTGRNAGRLKPSAPNYRASAPDLDKLVRAVGDALSGIAIRDDAAIVRLRAQKVYGSPAAHVTLTQLPP